MPYYRFAARKRFPSKYTSGQRYSYNKRPYYPRSYASGRTSRSIYRSRYGGMGRSAYGNGGYKKRGANQSGVKRTKSKDSEFTVITSDTTSAYSPSADAIPSGSLRYRLVHISDPSVVSEVEGRTSREVQWSGTVDNIEYDLNDDTVIEHRTIYFLGGSHSRGSTDIYDSLTVDSADTPNPDKHYARCPPARAIVDAGAAVLFRSLFVEKTVHGAVRGALTTKNFTVIHDQKRTIRGSDGGSLQEKKTSVYFSNAKKPILTRYAQDGNGQYSDILLGDSRPLYRMDIYVRGVNVRNLPFGEEQVLTPESSHRGSASSGSSGKSKVSVKVEPTEAKMASMDLDRKSILQERLSSLEDHDDDNVFVRITSRVFYQKK